MISVKQYQDFCRIPSGSTEMEMNKQLAKLIGLDTTKLTNDELTKKIKEWLGKIVVSRKKHNHIRLGEKWYKVDRDLYTLTFSQWIYFDDTMRGMDDNNTYEILHFMIATFLRECKVYKFFPKRFDVNNIEHTAKLIQDNLSIEVALELVNFFLKYILDSMQTTQIEYLERLEKTPLSDKMTD